MALCVLALAAAAWTGCGESDELFTLPQTTSITPTGKLREFALTARPMIHDLGDGVLVDAYAFNDQVPGPTLRVTEGDRVRITVTNELSEPTSVHWHGLHLPYQQDGAAPLNQPLIQPGETRVYDFMASHAGTFMYHPHGLGTEAEQIDKGLYGVFVIDPQKAAGQPRFDAEYTLMLNGWVADMPAMAGHGAAGDYNAWSINGKLYPQTEPIRVQKGQRIRLRLLNLSNGQHPMHIHGHDLIVMAQDGEPLSVPQRVNTLNISPGQTFDAYIVADNPGVWMFHCHELHHAESGMGTTVVYAGFDSFDGTTPPGGHDGGHE